MSSGARPLLHFRSPPDGDQTSFAGHLDLCKLIFGMVIALLRSRVALGAEILVLRQQI
jgi:hypothetical protein